MEIHKPKNPFEKQTKFAGKVLDAIDDHVTFSKEEGSTLLTGIAIGTAVVLFLEFVEKKLTPPKR